MQNETITSITDNPESAHGKVDVLSLLKNADIDDLESQLAEKERELEETTAKLDSDVKALRMVIKFVRVAQNKPEPALDDALVTQMHKRQASSRFDDIPEPAGRRAADSLARVPGKPSIADRAVTYLEAAGDATPSAIAHGIAYENASYLNSVMEKDHRFTKTTKGTYRLSGRQ